MSGPLVRVLVAVVVTALISVSATLVAVERLVEPGVPASVLASCQEGLFEYDQAVVEAAAAFQEAGRAMTGPTAGFAAAMSRYSEHAQAALGRAERAREVSRECREAGERRHLGRR